jgi:hypothetical protein
MSDRPFTPQEERLARNLGLFLHADTMAIACDSMIALVDSAMFPKCAMCEYTEGLLQCRNCHEKFCMDCQSDHVCGSGPEPTQGRF